jgi:hypothetical protein
MKCALYRFLRALSTAEAVRRGPGPLARLMVRRRARRGLSPSPPPIGPVETFRLARGSQRETNALVTGLLAEGMGWECLPGSGGL